MQYQIGIDAGLESVKFIAVKGKSVLGKLLIPAEHESISSLIRRGMNKIIDEFGLKEKEYRVGVTGIGAQFADFPNKLRETSCCGAGIQRVSPDIKTVLDMGSERSVVMKLVQGKALHIARNERCAAGSGRFLKNIAEIMMVSLDDIGPLALSSNCPAQIESTCAVFGESEIISMIHSKINPSDILAGVCLGLAARLFPLFRRVAFEPKVAFIGGVSKNVGMVRALGEQLRTEIYVPQDALYIKALGAAILAGEAAE